MKTRKPNGKHTSTNGKGNGKANSEHHPLERAAQERLMRRLIKAMRHAPDHTVIVTMIDNSTFSVRHKDDHGHVVFEHKERDLWKRP